MTGRGGGGDRGTGTEGADVGHRLGEGAERGIVVVTACDLGVHVPIGDPAVDRWGRFAALIAGFVGGSPPGAEPQPAVDRAARGTHAAWRDRPDLDIEPRAKTITIEGTEYKLIEHGTASYRSEGTTGLNEKGGVDYVDYESDDHRLLAFERFDHGRWEVSTGESIPVGSFTIYSGS